MNRLNTKKKNNPLKKTGFSRMLRYGFISVPVVLMLIIVLLWLSVQGIYSMQESALLNRELGNVDTLDKWVRKYDQRAEYPPEQYRAVL